MIVLAWILLLTASTRVELTDDVYQIPPKDWLWVPVTLRQKPAEVSAHFEVQSASRKARVALMTHEDLDRLNTGMPHSVLAVSEWAGSGSLRYRVRHRGDYGLLVDNRESDRPAAVHLRIALDFAPAPPGVTAISPQRQLAVILMSFAFFAGVVTYSARRLWLSRQR